MSNAVTVKEFHKYFNFLTFFFNMCLYFNVRAESEYFLHLWSFEPPTPPSPRQVHVLIVVVIFHSVVCLCCTSIGFHHHHLLRQPLLLRHQRLELSQHVVAHCSVSTWKECSERVWVWFTAGQRSNSGEGWEEWRVLGSVDSLCSLRVSVVSPVDFRLLIAMKAKLL